MALRYGVLKGNPNVAIVLMAVEETAAPVIMSSKRKSLFQKRGIVIARTVIQIAFVALIANLSIRHMLFGNGPGGNLSLHSYCPLGGFETLFTWITDGTFLKKTRSFNLTLFAIVGVSSLLIGRSFCGWVCPFGSVIEWLGRLGRKASINIQDFSPLVDKALRSIKYLVLIAITLGTLTTGRMVFADYDPYPALFHFGVWTEISSAAIIILAVTLISSIFIERAWCRYACPLGAITAILAKVSFIRIKSVESSCRGCSSCSDLSCPMGIDKNQLKKTSTECIMCLRCVDECGPGSIKITARTSS